MAQGVPMGRGGHDFPRIAAILREQAPGMFWDLEVVTGRPPQLLAYFDPASGFWDAFPDMPARDFARFLSVAARGTPDPLEQAEAPPRHRSGPLNYVPPPGELGATLVRQQREHFEESVRYCREVLGLGERQNPKGRRRDPIAPLTVL
jgi:hypothetical protein